MRELSCLTGAAWIACASGLAAAQPVTWDGDAGDGLWTSPQNWDTDALPSLSSLVDIPSGSGQVSLVLSGATIASLSCGSSLRLDSSSISVSGDSSVMNLAVQGGFNPTITTGGAFTISGASSAQSLTLNGTGSFVNSGTFDAFSVGLDSIAASNTGAWNTPLSASVIGLNGTSTLDNSGTITLTGDSAINGPGALTNSGTITRSGGAGIASIHAPFTQSAGAIRVVGAGATLALESSPWSIDGGNITVLDNGTAALSGSNTMAQTRSIGPVEVSGTGSVQFFANNDTIRWEGETVLTVDGAGAELRIGFHDIQESVRNAGTMEARGAVITGPGAFTNSAQATFTIPLGNSFTAATTFNNRGTLDIEGTLFLNDNSVLSHTNGVIALRDDASIASLTPMSSGEIRSNRVVRFNAANPGASVTISTPYSAFSSSTTHVQDGYLTLSGGGVFSGASFTFGGDLSDAILAIEGDPSTVYTVPVTSFFNDPKNGRVYAVRFGTITTGPDISIASGHELTSTVVIEFNNATTSGPGVFKNAGGMLWNGGDIGSAFTSIANLVIPFGATPTLSGAMLNLSTVEHSGYLELNGGTVDNQQSWTMQESGTLAAGATPGLFTNNAQFVADDPSLGAHLVSAPFSNVATVEAKRGNLTFSGDVTQFDRMSGDLSGGLWIATEPDASITFTQEMVRLSGGVIVRGGSLGFPEIGTLERLENGATAQLLDTLINGPLVNDDATLDVMGAVMIGSDYTGTNGSKTTIRPGATLETIGTLQVGDELDSAADDINPIVTIARAGAPTPSIVTPLLDLHDRFTINGSGSGEVLMSGDLSAQPSATIATHLSMGSSIDRLTIEGHATIDGTLEVTLLDGPPPFGSTLLLISTTQGVSGDFSDVVIPNGDPILTFTTQIVGDDLFITATSTCAADLDNSGTLSFGDVTTFLTLYGMNDLRVDFDTSGSLNFGDVTAFLNLYAQGCP